MQQPPPEPKRLEYPTNPDLIEHIKAMANIRTNHLTIDPRWYGNEGEFVEPRAHIHARPFHNEAHTHTLLYGWRFLEAFRQHLLTAAREMHPDVQWMGMDVKLEMEPPMHQAPLIDIYASRENDILFFGATYLGGSDRYSRPDLVELADGTVKYVEEVTKDDSVSREQRVDYQTVIFEDTSVSGRPRRIYGRVYGEGMVDRFRRGQKVKVFGVYRSRQLHAGKSKRKSDAQVAGDVVYEYHIEVIHMEAADDALRASWTDSEVKKFGKALKELGTDAYLKALTDSVAHVVKYNHWPKLAGLMTCVGGIRLSESEPPNIHAMFIGDPGTGKSAMARSILRLMPNSIFVDAQGMSARGLTFGTEDYNGEKIVSAGLMVLYNHLGIEEIGDASGEHFSALKDGMSSEEINYNVTNAKISQPVDVSLILVGNPSGGMWDDDKTAVDNLRPVPAAIITRANTVRVELDSDHEGRSRRMMHKFLGKAEDAKDVARFSETELAHWLDYASKLEPKHTPETGEAIVSFFRAFWGVSQEPGDDALAQTRMEVNMYRNSAAIAKLCGATEVAVEHVMVAIEFFTASLTSLGLKVKDAPAELGATRTGRDAIFMMLLRALDEQNGIRGFQADDMIDEMVKSTKWPDADHAWEYWRRHKDQHVFSPSSARGRYRKQ